MNVFQETKYWAVNDIQEKNKKYVFEALSDGSFMFTAEGKPTALINR